MYMVYGCMVNNERNKKLHLINTLLRGILKLPTSYALRQKVTKTVIVKEQTLTLI